MRLPECDQHVVKAWRNSRRIRSVRMLVAAKWLVQPTQFLAPPRVLSQHARVAYAYTRSPSSGLFVFNLVFLFAVCRCATDVDHGSWGRVGTGWYVGACWPHPHPHPMPKQTRTHARTHPYCHCYALSSPSHVSPSTATHQSVSAMTAQAGPRMTWAK